MIVTKTHWSEDRDWSQIDFEVVLITPEIATRMLMRNQHNRPFRPARAIEFMAILKVPGKFKHTNEGVAFYEDGTLADAQHRLAAIRRSGISVVMDVRYGVPLDASQHINTGIRRRPGDVLSLIGEKDTNVLGAAYKLVWQYLMDNTSLVIRFSDYDQLMVMRERHGDIRDFVPVARKINKEIKIPPSAAAAAAYLTSSSTTDETDWYDGLLGIGSRYPNDPRTALERQVRDARKRQRRMNGLWLVAIYGSAFRAYERDRDVELDQKQGVRSIVYRSGTTLPLFGRVEELRKRERELDAQEADVEVGTEEGENNA